MAYRSFKRALGETSLEKKCRWMFGTALLVLMLLSFWLASRQTDEIVYSVNEMTGRQHVGGALTELHANEILKQGEQGEIGNQLLLNDLRRAEFNWYAIIPDVINPNKPAQDPIEFQLLERWANNGQELAAQHPPANGKSRTPEEEDVLSEEITSLEKKLFEDDNIQRDGKPYYRYYQPVFLKRKRCLDCHSSVHLDARQAAGYPEPELAIGDLVAVMRIEVNQEPVVEQRDDARAWLVTCAFVTAFLSMIALWTIVKFVIVKPLNHLREVSNAVRRGDVRQRAKIETGDEFEDLAAAFNRMVRQLVSQQDELRQVNGTLDGKIDELAEANMRLFEMNRLKSDFLSTVSHELRTPLNSILGFSDVLVSNPKLAEKQKRYANNIQKSGRMLLDMINDILDLAKIESGRIEVRTTEFRIDTVVTELCDLARPLAERKNIDLDYEIQPGLPTLSQDYAKTQQILNNLLSNAIKFTPEGGRIVVLASRSLHDALLLTVVDTGIGISESEQKLVFEKFRQGKNVLPSGDAMTREYSGTGLGLSIVKELCRLLGGEIRLRSELGRGSTFEVELPWIRREEIKLDQDLTTELDILTKPVLRNLGPEAVGSVSGDPPSQHPAESS